jgi:hypothetical protein
MTTLELELIDLKARVERLEERVRRLTGEEPAVAPPAPGEPVDQEQLIAWLKAEGLVVDPPPMARVHAERWRALPEEEKQIHIRFMRSLVLDPPLSQIILENRR